jgi:DNA repair exonuclease SbcCD ATPase subunit
MITFEKVKWQNFLSTGNQWTELQLNRSVSTLIVGENGAGKSTILDAIMFALYGKPYRNINKPQLVNSITNKDCAVEIEFTTKGKHYRVRRGIKPAVFEIYADDVLIDQNANIKEYQEMLEKTILKLNHKSFTQIVVIGSANYMPFMQMKPGDRRSVIEDLLDIEIFTKMNTILKERANGVKAQLTEQKHEIEKTEQKIELTRQHAAKITSMVLKNKEDKENEIQIHKKKYEDTVKAIRAYDKDIKNLESKLPDIDTAKNKEAKLNQIKANMEFELKQAAEDNKFYKKHDDCPTCKQTISEAMKKKKIAESVSKQTELNDAYEKLTAQFDKINKVRDEWNEVKGKISEVTNQQSVSTALLSSIKQDVTKLMKEQKEIVPDSIDDDIIELETLVKDKQANYKVLLEKKAVNDIGLSLLKDTGIKAKIVKQYVPVINKLMNKYLAAMEFFVQFELDENFNEVIKSRHRDEFTYDSFSEGEKMRIDLSLLFTWRAVAKLRNSITTNLLIMDEVFDSSLDNTGTDEFLKLITQLASDSNVFVISHKGDQLYDKFHSNIKFEKIKNFSHIAS